MLCAGSGAALIDGAGRTLLMGVAYAEMALVAVLLVVATVHAVRRTPPRCRVPALGLLALAVPVGKLLLAGAPSAQALDRRRAPASASAGPTRCRPTALLATLTLGVIGAALCAVAILAPVAGRRRRQRPRVGRLHPALTRPPGDRVDGAH